jgi:CheY-like chemotaxis protein
MNPIMIVEDEADLRDTLKDVLELYGYRVITAANGAEALQQLESRRNGGRPCLILLDLMMPVMNGWELLDRLRDGSRPELAAIPVVVVSAAADLTRVQERYQCRSIRKPAPIHAFLEAANEFGCRSA